MSDRETAVFGGGCFWCTEAVFQRVKGVVKVTPGYAGGFTKDPTYDQVTSGTTGHAEVVKVEYDPDKISYHNLLNIFYAVHDPTTKDRQGNDVGPQYRSLILTTTLDQHTQAVSTLKPNFTTEVKPLTNFYPAESYHLDFYNQNRNQAYCRLIIDPKIKKLFGGVQ